MLLVRALAPAGQRRTCAMAASMARESTHTVPCKVLGVSHDTRLSTWGKTWHERRYDLASESELVLGAKDSREAPVAGNGVEMGDYVSAEIECSERGYWLLHDIDASIDVDPEAAELIDAKASEYTPRHGRLQLISFSARVESVRVDAPAAEGGMHVHWYTVVPDTPNATPQMLLWRTTRMAKPLMRPGYPVHLVVQRPHGDDDVLHLRGFELKPMSVEGYVEARSKLNGRIYTFFETVEGQKLGFWEGETTLPEGTAFSVSLVPSSSGRAYAVAASTPMAGMPKRTPTPRYTPRPRQRQPHAEREKAAVATTYDPAAAKKLRRAAKATARENESATPLPTTDGPVRMVL